MDTRQRILSILLMEKLNQEPKYKKRIQVETKMVKGAKHGK